MIFLVTAPPSHDLNVLVNAGSREMAKRTASTVLRGDMDDYTVTPVTEQGTRVVFMMSGEAFYT